MPRIHNYLLSSSVRLFLLIVRGIQSSLGKGGGHEMQASKGDRDDNRSGEEGGGYI